MVAYRLCEKVKPEAVGPETEEAIAYLDASETIALYQKLQRQKSKQKEIQKKKTSGKPAKFFGKSLSTAVGRVPLDRVGGRVVR